MKAQFKTTLLLSVVAILAMTVCQAQKTKSELKPLAKFETMDFAGKQVSVITIPKAALETFKSENEFPPNHENLRIYSAFVNIHRTDLPILKEGYYLNGYKVRGYKKASTQDSVYYRYEKALQIETLRTHLDEIKKLFPEFDTSSYDAVIAICEQNLKEKKERDKASLN
ncbi:MAG: hypothetical protein HOP30_11115 [Cyclobacteriaceae bacterium]|nr:hypothetical protein [Cyclobacteriaceae bacterium]